MEKTKFGPLSDSDITKSIHEITESSYTLKKEIFKTILQSRDLNQKVVLSYLSSVNDFLRFWDEYSEDLTEKIKTTSGSEGIYTIDYNVVKEYIYAKYDYASILPFTDGLIKGITSGKFSNVDDIEDFKDFTLSKAFNDLGSSTAAVLDSVLLSGNGMNLKKETGPLEAKSFDSIKNYNMFDRRNRKELFKAIEKTVEFMTTDVSTSKFGDIKDMKIIVSLINNVVEYINYSLAAYSARIYIISEYAYPFITSSVNAHTESTVLSDANHSTIDITTLRDADEMICRDPAKTEEFMNIFSKFLTDIGADPLFGTRKPSFNGNWVNNDDIKDNTFCSKLMVNPLHEFLTVRRYEFCGSSPAKINELNSLVRTLIYNSNQGIQGTASPKQEMLYIIRGGKCEETIKGYQELAKDLYECGIQLCVSMYHMIQNLYDMKRMENESPVNNTGALNTASETLKILSEFYRDLASAILQKGRDIELHINNLKSNELDKLSTGLSIKLPNHKADISTNDIMMTAVPDTTRLSTDMIDMYAQPTFEYMQLYTEYLRTLPGMDDDFYFSEAFNISEIFNKIISRIRASWEKLKSFYEDKKVKTAMQWAISHENDFARMDFSGSTMSVLPYKLDLNLPKNYNNLVNNLQKFDPKNFESEEGMKSFIKTLYPSEAVYNWFAGDNGKITTGAAKYRSYILFANTENEATDTPPQTVPLDAKQIAERIPKWVETLKESQKTFDEYKKIGDAIETAVNAIKTKAVITDNTTSSTSSASTTNKNDTPPSMPTDNGNNNSGSGNNAEGQQTTSVTPNVKVDEDAKKLQEKTETIQKGLDGITIAIARLYSSLNSMFIEYTKAEYKYLKDAYSMGRKSS